MWIAVLSTYYEIYAIGETREEAMKNCAKGYRKFYKKEERSEETKHGTVKELNDYFGINSFKLHDKWCSQAD